MATSVNVEKAYTHIRDQILAGVLAPGAVISEAALAKELGVSRTPVGEALRELSSVGLVEQVPRYGTIVRGLSREDLVELFEVREALEPQAVALAAVRITPEDVEKLGRLGARLESFRFELESTGQERLEGQRLREFVAAGMAFHALLIQGAGNRRMAKLVHDAHVLTELFGTQRLVHDRRVVVEACQFHARIVAAVRGGDGETARAVVVEQIRAKLANTLGGLGRDRSRETLPALTLPADVRAELSRIEPAPGSRDGNQGRH